ncbi:MAG: hypothetical protein ACYDAR_13190 [Thermomicrobiales bacterium]
MLFAPMSRIRSGDALLKETIGKRLHHFGGIPRWCANETGSHRATAAGLYPAVRLIVPPRGAVSHG